MGANLDPQIVITAKSSAGNDGFIGNNISYIGNNISFIVNNISYIGNNISFIVNNISCNGNNISFIVNNISYIGNNISCNGNNISYINCIAGKEESMVCDWASSREQDLAAWRKKPDKWPSVRRYTVK
ncbi:hypothetical protein FACS1894200_09130 [Spirochaetia bacterium]|nr:hypothetical protein FACS1894200_09130 [Spirochaetia bacterium]